MNEWRQLAEDWMTLATQLGRNPDPTSDEALLYWVAAHVSDNMARDLMRLVGDWQQRYDDLVTRHQLLSGV